MADDVDLVRSRTDIVQLVGQRVLLRRTGKTWKGLCPFHDDKNPSMQVDPLTGRYRCWSCGAKGDVFDWVMNTESVEFPEALRLLAAQAGVELTGRKGEPQEREAVDEAMGVAQSFFRASLAASPEALAYLEQRGIEPAVATDWGIGFAPPTGDRLAHSLSKAGCRLALCESLFLVGKDPSGGYFDRFRGRIMFPIRDERGRLVAFGGRALGDAQPKYINSGDTPVFRKGRVLYGMDRARQAMAKGRRAILAEGYLDVIALHRAGLEESVAPLGTALGPDHAKLLRRWAEKAVLVFDGDPAGLKASDRSIEVLESEGLYVSVATLPDGADPDTVLARSGPEALRQAVDAAATPVAFRLAALRKSASASDPEFWSAAVQILAQAGDLLERSAHIERLAAEYPGTRDLTAARAALEAMVEEARPRRAKARPSPHAQKPAAEPKMRALEALPFLALAQPALAPRAWELIRDPEVFHSGTARQVAQALAGVFGDAPPAGKPSVWLAQVADHAARDALEELFLTERGQYGPIEEAALEEAARRLRHRHSLRQRKGLSDQAIVDDSALAALSSQLRDSPGRGI